MNQRKAVLVTYPDKYIFQEVLGLAQAADYEVVHVITQSYLSRAKYGIGSGKAQEVLRAARELQASVILFDEKLNSIQVYNLAKLTGVEVIDREKLILEIFQRRTTSAESKLQVQLAELRYEMPRSKEKVRLAKLGEQPGFSGLGAYEVNVYYRALKRRLSVLSRKLQEVTKRRELFRHQRQRLSVPIVSLSGYTGVGKTSLFNALTGESKEVAGGAFTTLTTSTRSVNILDGKVFLSDTVGFISGLPTYMIEAFKSTLEELRYANLVLLLVDVSEPTSDIIRKYGTSVQVLSQLEVSPSKVLLVFNKSDLISEGDVDEKLRAVGATFETAAVVSAKTEAGVDLLKARIAESVFEQSEFQVPMTEDQLHEISKYMDWVKENASVELIRSGDGQLLAQVKGPSWIVDRFSRYYENIKTQPRYA